MLRFSLFRAGLAALPVLVLAACQDEDIDLVGPSADTEATAFAPAEGNGMRKGGASTTPKIAFAVLPPATAGIHTVNPDGTGYAMVANTEAGRDPAWSPDRRRIAFTVINGPDAGLYVVGTNGRKKTKLYSGSGAGAPAWSPDGMRIAFHATTSAGVQVFVMDASGSNLQQATAVGSVNSHPIWSPDGSRMVYYSNRSPGRGLWIMNSDGTSRSLLRGCDVCTAAAWNPVPGDDRIAYVHRDNGTLQMAGIQIITATGVEGPLLVFGNHGGQDLDPSWSPDGRQLVFSSSMLGGGRDLLTMNADGSDVQRVVATPAVEAGPAWAW